MIVNSLDGHDDPKYTMPGRREIRSDANKYGTTLYCFKTEIQTPSYSF